jgi:RimJ/RimL family protein N-acetyltransferase
MTINCGTFILRYLHADDAESIARYANNINIKNNLRDSFPHPYTIEDAKIFLSRKKALPTELAIECNGKCIGVIGIILQEDVYRKNAEFGYWLAEPFWRKGIMTTAAKHAIPHFFKTFNLERLFACVYEWNPGSMKVLENAGFKFDCVFEKSIYKNNQLINEHRYSLLRKDANLNH